MKELKQRNFESKKRNGHELPDLCKIMTIKVNRHVHENRPYNYSDIIFYNHLKEIAKPIRYVAYEINTELGRIYFKFYTEKIPGIENKQYVLHSEDAGKNHAVINVYPDKGDNRIVRYWSNNSYPVFRLPSSDEYFINLGDAKDIQKNLINRTTDTAVQNEETIKTQIKESEEDEMKKLPADTRINSDALREAIEAKGLTLGCVSTGIGFKTKTSLCKVLNRGTVNSSFCDKIEDNYNIKKSLFVLGPVVNEPEVKTAKPSDPSVQLEPGAKQKFVTTIDMDEFFEKLGKVIYDNVYEAVHMVWDAPVKKEETSEKVNQ